MSPTAIALGLIALLALVSLAIVTAGILSTLVAIHDELRRIAVHARDSNVIAQERANRAELARREER